MNFFRAQDEARGRTTKLVALLCGAVILAALSPSVVGIVVSICFPGFPFLSIFITIATITMLIAILIGSSRARAELAKGGSATACQLGAEPVFAQTTIPAEKVYLNVVEEMALASGLPVPSCFVFSCDAGINAFAAGNHPKDAAIALTQGALAHLNREELQGVVAYAMSHIANSDIKLYNRFIGVAGGFNMVGKAGLGMGMGISFLIFLLAYGFLSIPAATSAVDVWIFTFFKIAIVILGFAVCLPLFAVGVFLMLLRGIGLGLTYALRASVWRQRESLGDASAVQFTRYPAGLASALKKVAEFGSEIESTERLGPEWDVLFFASSRGGNANLTSLRSSIAGRIKLIDPNFDGVLPRYTEDYLTKDHFTEVQRQAHLAWQIAAAKAAADMASYDASHAAAKASAVPDKQLQAIFSFGGTLPPELRAAASEPVGAMGIVLGLILRQDATLREQQLKQAEGLAGGEVVKEARKLAGALRALPPGQRIPLLDVAMPALRQLSSAQVSEFSAAINQVRGEAADGLMSLLIHASMRRYLSAVPRRAGRAGDFGTSCALVLAAVVQSSSEGPEAQAAAYLRGNQILGLKQVALGTLPVAPVNLKDVEDALGIIAHPSAPEGWGQKLVNACCAAMLNDGKAEPAEVEIVRAVADTLGIVLTRSGTQHQRPIYATL
jgi:Zn-dependent protease with chaperone function